LPILLDGKRQRAAIRLRRARLECLISEIIALRHRSCALPTNGGRNGEYKFPWLQPSQGFVWCGRLTNAVSLKSPQVRARPRPQPTNLWQEFTKNNFTREAATKSLAGIHKTQFHAWGKRNPLFTGGD
jgi:hypothetical protein